MSIYFILLLYIYVIGFFCFGITNCSVNNKKMKLLFTILVIVPMGVIVGVRESYVGSDTPMYYEIFRWICDSEFSFSIFDDIYHVELGYRWINYLISLFTNDPHIFMFIVSFTIIILYGKFFYRDSDNIWLSFLLFVGLSFYIETFNTVRQQIACTIIFLATQYLITGNRWKWTISVFLAMFFHITAAFFLLFNFLIPMTKRRIYFFTFGSLVGLFLVANILSLIAQLFPDFKYLYYFAQPNMGEGSLGDYLRAILFTAVLIFVYLKRNALLGMELDSFEKKRIVLWNIFLLYAIIFIVAKQEYAIFYRMIQYCSPFICLLLPKVLEKLGLIRYQLYFMLFFILPLVLYYLLKINISALMYSSFLLD